MYRDMGEWVVVREEIVIY
uniref:Uncharacterized protein n=1 Tax=Anguilla anguilla TaxID=7936 RepID=A0A0E9TAZ3_ANGAN